MGKNIFQHELIERLVKYRDKTAVENGSKVLTYAELDGRSDCIANWIIGKGIKKETPIGILIEDRSDFILAVIGILKAGCVFVPLSSVLPKDRLGKMIDAVDIDIIISDKVGFNYLAAWGDERRLKRQIVIADDLLAGKKSEWSTNCPAIHYTAEDRIYIYFTSGSTGTPRAIVGKNKSLLHFIDWEIETFNIDVGFRISQLITPLFDAFLRDVFVPLFAGGVICIPGGVESMPEPGELVRWIDRSGVHLIHCVPGLFRIFSAHAVGDNFRSLKYILLSGESIKPSDLVNWYNTFGDGVQLVNLYGPTETTMIKSFYFIGRSDVNRERIPVGKPLKGTRIIVCDENLKMCNELVTGEIYIRTPFRTHGYYNDSQLNRERFIRNPYTSNPDDILYKTGDLGRLLPDGNIEFLGRIDRQVKIRGIRVELEEIENVLAHHAAVKEAAVIKQEISTASTLLIGYITGMENSNSVPGEKSLTADLKGYLSGILPGYMVPDKIVKIEKFPRTPNGKIDYESLSGLYKDGLKNYSPPENRLEQGLLEIWTEILGLEETGKIGRDDNFFEVGGNSLNIMSLISKIHREFNVRVFLAQIFNNPTIEKQARIIRESSADLFHGIPEAEKKDYYPLAPAQKRLYILQQMDIESQAYNMPMVMILEGNLDGDQLEKVFGKLIQRHESLRTSFELKDSEPVQRIHREVVFRIEHYELENEESIVNGFSRFFYLSDPPLLRVGLINVGQTRHILMTDMHHIVADGISMGLLTRDFAVLYAEGELPGLKLNYKDYSEWRNSDEQKKAKSMREEFWLKEFSGEPPVIDLHTDYERPAIKSYEGSRISFEIHREMFARLKTLAAQKGTTLFVILLSLFNIMLSKICSREDIIVGSPTAGRRRADLEHIIGMLANTLALRNYPKNNKTFGQFLDEVKTRTLDVLENQDYQFEDLVERLELDNNPARNPLFDVLFVLQNQVMEEVEMPGLKLLPYSHDFGTSKFDLTLNCREHLDTLYCSYEYCTKLFKSRKIERFITYFKEIMETVLSDNDIMLGDIKISHHLISLHQEDLEMDFAF